MANILEKASKKFKGERTLGTLLVIGFMLVFWVFLYTPYRLVFTACVALIAVAATYEIQHAIGVKNKVLYAVSMAYSVLEVFLISYKAPVQWNVVLTAYVLLVLIITVVMHEKTQFNHATAALLASIAYSYAFSCFILIRDYYLINDNYTKQDCFWLVLVGFGGSWLTDSFAFLVGRKLGKHKLCPKISPKKSVEGAIGGVVGVVIAANIVYVIYNFIITKIYGFGTLGEGGRKFLVMSALSVVLAVISMFGDLSASVLKRNYGLKDFSNLIPGHGGIMDRFDSSIFVLPTLYMLISSFELFY